MNAIETNAAKKAPGRPKVEGSARQQKLAAMAARKQANGGTIKLGRPAVEGSKRQQEIAEKQAKLASGYVPKKGRPSFASQGLMTRAELAKAGKTVNTAINTNATPVANAVKPQTGKSVEEMLKELKIEGSNHAADKQPEMEVVVPADETTVPAEEVIVEEAVAEAAPKKNKKK